MRPETEAAIRAEWQAARERPGAEGGPCSVRGDVYADPARLERERRAVFDRAWHPVARERELPAAGDFRAVDVAGTPVVVLRGSDGGLACLLNVCTHRGAQVVRTDAGRLERLTCPYHGLTFDLDGRRTGCREAESFAPGEPEDLPRLGCATWGGWVWVCLHPDAAAGPHEEQLAAFLGPELLDELDEWPFGDLQVAEREVFEATFDWKVGVEAFLESLHLPSIHARTAAPLLDHRRTAQAGLGSHSRMSTPFRTPSAYAPTGPMGLAAQEAGVELFPRLNDVQRTSNFSYLIFPCTVLNLLPTHLTRFHIQPTGTGTCRFEYELYAAPATTPAQERYVASLGPGYRQLLDEDLVNLPWIQRGLASGARPRLGLSAHERRILHFHETLERWLA